MVSHGRTANRAGWDERVVALAQTLDTVQLSGPPILERALSDLVDALEFSAACAYRPVNTATGWEIDLFQVAGRARAKDIERRLRSFVADTRKLGLAYDPTRPAKSQRNKVVAPIPIVSRPVFEAMPFARQVLAPAGMHRYEQLRVLVCEGPSLLAWVGGFTEEQPTRAQRAALQALTPALVRRLAFERELARARLARAAVDALMECVGAPAFLVNAQGCVMQANSAGSVALSGRARELRAALKGAVLGAPTVPAFRTTRLAAPGLPPTWLLVERPSGRAHAAVVAASSRWGLSSRQREVLALVACGASNAVIGASLDISERTVEVHVSAIFDRARVGSRAALVAKLLEW